MHLLILFALGLISLIATSKVCTTPFDILRAKSEDLGEELYLRASWRDVWLNLVPRGDYPKGAGYVRSSFQIGRSEPSTDEEAWQQINPIDTGANTAGACGLTYNQTFAGHHEDLYKPSMFGLMGPAICQDDLTMYWKSEEFWERYFQALDKRNRKSIINRLGNVYRQYSYKASANPDFHFIPGNTGTQPPSSIVDLSGLLAGVPQSELTQEMLDGTAIELMEEGADEPNSNGWITQGADGAEFPLLIGSWMSQRLFLNNSELRSDVNQSFQGWKEANPTLKRLGASRILKNFRHVINRFPARWALMSSGATINYQTTGTDSGSGKVQATLTNSVGAATPSNGVTPTGAGTNANPYVYFTQSSGVAITNFFRIPTFVQSINSLDATKGQVAVVNGAWRDPAVATYESVEVLNPMVMKEEVLMPVNSLPGAKLKPQNYFGEWKFVTGNDAFLGIAGCTGITDPMGKQGRHFAEYRAGYKPIFPIFGRMILFKRCASSYDSVTCS